MSTPAPFKMPKRPLTWVVTGCSSGFGLELVRIAQANGHFVIASSRNPSKTPDLVSEVESKGGKWLKLNVDDAESATLLDTIEKEGHAIDILVNNAGFALYGAAEQFTEDEVHRLFETNFFGAYRLSRTAVRYMRERRFGVIVNISSAAALRHVPTMGIYGASKAALDNVHKTMAREMENFNVRFLTVNPSTFDTPITQALQFQESPLENDYQRQEVGFFLDHMTKGTFPIKGDTNKAIKAIYEVVVGEGVGEGHENEPVLPLGADLVDFINNDRAQWQRTLDAFGEVSKSVDHETK